MTNARVTGLRGVELAVRSLPESGRYYQEIWGLVAVEQAANRVYLRGRGPEHHIVTLHERPKAGLVAVSFAAADKAAVDELHGRAKAFGAKVLTSPGVLAKEGGGGYGFSLETPEGQTITVSCDVARHGDIGADRSTPQKLTHVVYNSVKSDEQMAFFRDLLGFRLSDSNGRMDFIRCSKDHHAVAIAKSTGPSLNHMAYEMDSFDSLMRGCGRLKAKGVELQWGVGRHGPGDNIFSYFIDPNGFVTEYTAEVEQIEDDAGYQAKDEAYWESFPMRPCRWGMATTPSKLLRHAMSGALLDERNLACDEIIAQNTAGRQ